MTNPSAKPQTPSSNQPANIEKKPVTEQKKEEDKNAEANKNTNPSDKTAKSA